MEGFWRKWYNLILVFLLISIFGSLILTGSLYVFHLSLFFLLFVGVSTKFFYTKNLKIARNYFLLKVFLYSFLIRVLFVYFFYYILTYFIGVPFLTFKDDYSYYLASKEIATIWSLKGFSVIENVKFSTGFYSGFPNISAFLIYLFNGDPVITPRIGNSFFSALTVISFYKITKLYANENNARLVSVFVMFSPLLIIFSSLQLKDTILLYFSSMLIYYMAKIILTKSNIFNVLFLILFSGLIIFFRPASLLPIYGAFFVIIIFKNKFKRNILKNWKIYFYSLFTILGLYYTWSFLTSYSLVGPIELYFDSRSEFILNGDFNDTNVGVSKTSFKKFLGAPIFLLASLFLPPVSIISLPYAETINYTFLGMLIHFSLLPFLIIAIFNTIKLRKHFLIPSFIILSFLFFKIGQANSIVSIFDPRQSLSTIAFMYLLIPMYFQEKRSKFMFNIIVVISVLIIMIFAYVRLSSRGLI